jgi:general secretion pathway protein E
MNQSAISPELKHRLREYLEKQGYKITEDAKLTGKSGGEHTFDMLAYTEIDGVKRRLGIDFIDGAKEISLEQVVVFASKAHETGIEDKAIVVSPGISSGAQRFAKLQGIKVIDASQKDSFEFVLFEEKPKAPEAKPKPESPTQPVQPEGKPKSNGQTQPVQPEAKPEPEMTIDYIQPKAPEVKPGPESPTQPVQPKGKAESNGQTQPVQPEAKPEPEMTIDYIQPKAPEVKPGPESPTQPVQPEAKPEPEIPIDYIQPKAPEVESETESAAPPVPPEAPEVKPEPKSLRHSVQPEALQLIPEVMARRYNAIPVVISGDSLEIAMADPTDIFALEAFSAVCRMRIKPVAADANEIREAIDFNYKGYGEIEKQISRVTIPSEATEERLAITADTDAPLAQALNLIIEEAVKARASDIHIEPEEDRLRVRYRIDGALQDMMSLPLNIHLALVSRIKILSDLNIADRHRPQDGQFSARAKGREIDIRVATAPTVNGEMAELRLLDKSVATLGLSELGMLPDSLEKYENMLKVPYGMIITSGPTGAGKTTTLYASINSLDCLERNIVTIEDPAEYRFKDINQIQVNTLAGITFATGLRSILRLDPDVIMVGEIRDAETANIAVQAALTGHLMLSSVHASDSSGVLSRLIDLGIEPFLIASAVIGVLAQRMVRRICPDCSHVIEAPVVEQIAYEKETGEKKTEFLYGTGCKSCAYTGYRGRTGIFEILTMSDTIRTMITSRASSSQIRAQALKEGMVTMMNDGMRKVKEGITNPSEVLRNAYSTG